MTLAQHVNYCFVPGGRVFSSANRHFFQLIFVVNQIKAKRDHETCSGVESFRPDPEIPELKN